MATTVAPACAPPHETSEQPELCAREIVPRNLHFQLANSPHDETAQRPYWYAGKPGITAFFDGLSIMFPPGERFFIRTVKNFQDQVTDPGLKRDIAAFTAQEHLHTREHVDYNTRLERLGFPAKDLEDKLAKRIAWAEATFPKKRQLAITCALEHFTAILAHQMLSDPDAFEASDTTYKQLWFWHAYEETEHKAVAFDVLKSVSGGLAGYLLRIRAMLFATMIFNIRIARHSFSLLKAKKNHTSWTAWKDLFGFLFIKPGLLRRAAGSYFAYFKPGFHPWQIDDRHLLERYRQEFAGTVHETPVYETPKGA